MNKVFTFVLVLFLGFQLSNAQDETYRRHRVQANETLETIARAYKVSPFDIIKLNPKAKEGIDTTMVLLIPSNSILGDKIKKRTVTFSDYKVRRKETIFGIAQKFKISVEDIKKHNPTLYTGELQKGSIIKIPKYQEEAVKTVSIPVGADTPVVATDTVKNASGQLLSSMQPKFKDSLVGFKKHKAKKRETLFSLSQRFNIAIDSIKKYNRFLYGAELKRGDRLQIPEYIQVEDNPFGDVDLVEYIVLPQEGKWRVAYKFGITQEELALYNPQMGEMLKDGELILVPNKSASETDQVDEDYHYYEVKKAEGFYRLKVKLGIEEEIIRLLNPEIDKLGGLKEGMILKIPKNSEGDFNVTDLLLTERFNLKDSIQLGHSSTIAVMLPFKLNQVDLSNPSDARDKIKDDELITNTLDFYSGLLMAVEEAKDLGLSTNVDVYDVEFRNKKLDDILLIKDFADTDVVIGPFLQSNVNKVAGHLSSLDIPIMSPIWSKDEQLYDNVFQTTPANSVLRAKMVKYIKDNIGDRELLIIADEENEAVKQQLLLEFPDAMSIDLTQTEKEKEEKRGKFVKRDALEELLVQEKEYWVLLETDNQVLGANVTSLLNAFVIEEFKITLFTTLKAKFYDEDIVANEHLANLAFHFPSVDNIRISGGSNSFEKEYKKQYNITPSKWAVRGYDLTMDTLLRLAYNENLRASSYLIGETEYVENKFHYERMGNKGFYNRGVYIIKYDGFSTKEVR
ncbi:LysM peptidoglycan-binding domain-containing protein [Spongiivirga citrea]|uniref:LysM peptidoglycan-binding domain-containing protein n=1 Tax=Spongiivirga citrea TaxID=1481457 RepID=A0A6M0CL84_9FLAO|nr:LysM peptidoglycan-binding domain-containing protein [Spongiivirga citrea]NER17743.1 LysM peptidoglycan-binding domain-containing protein [Spongiivirga citrea]